LPLEALEALGARAAALGEAAALQPLRLT